VRFTVSGYVLELDPVSARARLAGHPPEPIQVHWVELDGQRWPPKQALEVISGLQRSSYISHQALGVLRSLGFETSEWRATPRVSAAGDVAAVISAEVLPQDAATLRVQLREAVEVLADFMGSQSLTTRISTLEQQLLGASLDEVVGIVEVAGVSRDTLKAALTVRSTMGRLNDVVHATVIALSLPRILEPGEAVSNRPSLAAGNDPSRKFDLETTHRVAEFKVSVWRGADAMRKRGAFADLVNLALDDSDKKKQLFVVGDQPKHFLVTSTSPAKWGLSKSSAILRHRFEDQWGSLEIPISDFRAGPGSAVEIIDLNTVIPDLDSLIGL
jgi:hypothetical protein